MNDREKVEIAIKGFEKILFHRPKYEDWEKLELFDKHEIYNAYRIAKDTLERLNHSSEDQ